MKTIAQAFIELAAHLEMAKFDDPDEAQGAEEIVSFCLSHASDEERSELRQVASERLAALRAEGSPAGTMEFYERFVSRINAVI